MREAGWICENMMREREGEQRTAGNQEGPGKPAMLFFVVELDPAPADYCSVVLEGC